MSLTLREYLADMVHGSGGHGALCRSDGLINALRLADGWTIPVEASNVHGITTERALEVGIHEKEAVDMLLAMWGRMGVGVDQIGHNEQFDRRMVRIGIKRFIDPLDPDLAIPVSDEWKAAKGVCTCWLSRPYTKLPKNKLPKLTEAYQHFMGKPMEGAHTAMGDVDGCLAVYFAIKDLEAANAQPVPLAA